MKTLAEFKRVLALPGVQVRMVSHNDKEPRSNIAGWRTVDRIQTNGVYFLNADGKTSWLDFGKASEWSFNGQYATLDQGWLKMVYEVKEN